MGQIPFINRAPFVSYTKINLFIYIYIYIYIENFSTYFFHVVFTMHPGTLYNCNLRMRSFRTPYFKVQRHFEVNLCECNWC